MTTESRSVWLERSRSDHGHGGPGWELGSCLWSPSTDRAGNDRYRIMREPLVGDVVIHLVDSILLGQSVVSGACRKVDQRPPSPAPWGDMAAYYRIDLRDYRPFARPSPLSKLMRGMAHQDQHGLPAFTHRAARDFEQIPILLELNLIENHAMRPPAVR
jgi:hypothetical protein